MGRSVLVFVAALVVGLGLAWLFLGRDAFDSGAPSEDSAGADSAADAAKDSGSGAAAGVTEAPPRAPVLFGRPRERRVGKGTLRGRLADVETSQPVAEVALLLAGRGLGDEDVSLRQTSDSDGTFRFEDVPAGDDYDLRMEPGAHPVRTVPAVQVPAGGSIDLGTIWLGAPARFEGRVVDALDRGVARAEVQVHVGMASLFDLLGNLGELISTLDRDPVPLKATLTDRDGRFVFEALDPGAITLVVRAAGFEQKLLDAVVTPARDDPRPQVIRLEEGTAVSGRVVDGSGRGLGGARVAAIAGQDPVSFIYGRRFSDTAADGRFRIETAQGAENLTLLATAPGYPLAMHKVDPGASGVEIVLERGATVVMRFLTDPDDRPLEGADVFVTLGDRSDLTADQRQSFATGVTDRLGSVTFETRPGQVQMMWVTHPDHATGMWTGMQVGFSPPGMMRGPEDATVKPGRQEMVFRLAVGVLVHGQVTDEKGAPVPGARVTALGGFQIGEPALTDANGRYRLPASGVGGGASHVALMVRADGFVQDAVSMGVSVPAGATEVTHDVKLQLAGVVAGRVLDASGRPVVGAEVRAEGKGGMLAALDMFRPVRGITGRMGRYVLDGVSPGDEIRVLARHHGFVDGASEKFSLEAGRSVSQKDIVLVAGGEIEIHVMGPDGGAVANVRVELSFNREDKLTWDFFESVQGDAAVRTDGGGRARKTRIPAGEVTLTASHAEFAPGTARARMPADPADPIRVEIRLRRPVSLKGRVLDSDGKPLAGASLLAVPGDADGGQGVPVRGRSDEDGAFHLEGLPEGVVVLNATAVGHQSRETKPRAPAEGLEIRLGKVDPDRERRRLEIRMKLMEVSTRLQDAANDAERQAILQEIQDLNAELGELREDREAGEDEEDAVAREER